MQADLKEEVAQKAAYQAGPDTDAQDGPLSPTFLYFVALTLTGFGLIVWQTPQVEGDLLLLGFLIILNTLAGVMLVDIYGESFVSVGMVITLAIIALFGVPGAVISGPFVALGPAIRYYRQIGLHAIPNAALNTVICAASAAAYVQLTEINPSSFDWQLAAGIGAATAADYFAGSVLISIPFLIKKEQSVKDIASRFTWLAPHYAALGVVGLALVAAYIALGVLGIVAFITPAVMMRTAMKQYVDKTKENVERLKVQNDQLQSANVEIRRVSDELRESYVGTLEALVNALDARDQETKGHSLRVSRYMMDIARELGVPEDTQEWLDMQRGSLLHDVGKIGVSDTILLKPGKLTEDEWTLMRLHPEIGYNMLKQVKFLSGAADIILQHHERWDGKGYPRGLANKDIMLGARIFNVVDTFDSMTSDRPYRRALSTQEALNEILRYSGSQFDPLVVEAFLDIYDTWVRQREEMLSEARVAA